MTETDRYFLFDAVIPELKAVSVKQVYQAVAAAVAEETGLAARGLYDKLMEQEQRATSGIGGGVAIPHLRLRKLKAPYTLFARLPHLVDFNAIDGQPVGLLCLLLSPQDSVSAHLRDLSRLTRLLRDETLCRQLQEAQSSDSLQAILLASRQKSLAA